MGGGKHDGRRSQSYYTWNVVRTGGGEGCVPRGDEGGKSGVSKGQVQNRGSGYAIKREASINTRGVEGVVRDVKSGVQAARRNDKFPLGEGAAGFSQWLVKVEVTQNKVRIWKKRKKPLKWYRAVRRMIRSKKVHRSDPEGVVGDPKRPSREKTSTDSICEES